MRNKLRYEFKYTYEGVLFDEVYNEVMLHPMMFREIYYERSVHNIYLDDIKLGNYYDNLHGVKDRVKHRIRWYNDDCNAVNPTLEYKCKKDKLGWKHLYKMPDFSLDTFFCWDDYIETVYKAFEEKGNDIIIADEISAEIPTLLNSYKRRYFISSDENFRVTIDYDLKYMSMGKRYAFSVPYYDDRIIMELKFDEDQYKNCSSITLPFGKRISNNSKYTTGMNAMHFNKALPHLGE